MSAERCVLDTNVISAILRRRPGVLERLLGLTSQGATIFACPVVHYEVLRGLTRRSAVAQLSFYHLIAADMVYDEFTRADWDLAAQLWADATRAGRPVGDADLLIAAYAINRGAVLVTANARHFDHPSLQVANWLEAPSAP